MKAPQWGRLVARVCVIAAVIAAGGFLWRQVRGSGDGAIEGRGWPEKIAMVCQGCAHAFEVASKHYLEDMRARGAGGDATLRCPACQGRDIIRAEHVLHQQHRFDDVTASH